jgi:hypothetical protein
MRVRRLNEWSTEMRRSIAILVLSVSLAGCSAASETDQIATVADPPNSASQFYNSPGTGPVGERFLADRTGEDLQRVTMTRNQFYISTGTGPVGERFLADRTGQDLEKVIVTRDQFYSSGTGPVGERFLPDRTGQDLERVTMTRNQFYISTGTGPVGERFLAADGNDLTKTLGRK